MELKYVIDASSWIEKRNEIQNLITNAKTEEEIKKYSDLLIELGRIRDRFHFDNEEETDEFWKQLKATGIEEDKELEEFYDEFFEGVEEFPINANEPEEKESDEFFKGWKTLDK